MANHQAVFPLQKKWACTKFNMQNQTNACLQLFISLKKESATVAVTLKYQRVHLKMAN
jgi:D-lyxose ketol-isomerase